MVQYLHHDPFFEQNKASACLNPKTDPFYPHLKFYKKNFGVIIFWLLDQNYFRPGIKT